MRSLFLIILLLLIAPAGSSANNSDYLLPMMSMIPNVPGALATDGPVLFSFVDYVAMEQARPGVPIYSTFEEYRADARDQEESYFIWTANIQRTSANFDGFPLNFLTQAWDFRETVGFDVFDVDRVLKFGTEENPAIIIQGNFNAEAISTAFTERGFAQTEQDGALIWRHPDGRDGTRMDIRSIDPANPFGGQLGRWDPVALYRDYLISARTNEVFNATLDNLLSPESSVDNKPSYISALQAITAGDGMMVQAAFLNPQVMSTMPPGENEQGYGRLPRYSAAVVADIQEGDNQVFMLALVFDNRPSARRGLSEFTERLTYFPNPFGFPNDLLLDQIPDMRFPELSVFPSDLTGQYVAQLRLKYAMPSNERFSSLSDSNSYWPSGQLMRRVMSAIYRDMFNILRVTE